MHKMDQRVSKDCFVASLLAMTLFFVPSLVFASVAGEVNKANSLYKQGKFDDSLGLYQEALDQDDKSPVVKYDLGTALYKKGDYPKAMEYLEQAAQDKNIKVKPKAEYNLGNVLYKTGIQKENTNVDEAIKSLQGALGHYENTIAVDPKDQDAIYNQDFVKKEIERLKQKKEQQKQQQKQQQQNQKQDKQDQQNQKQDKQDQQNQQEPSHTEDSYKSQQKQDKQNKKEEQQSSQQNSPKDQKEQKQQSAQDQAKEDQKDIDRKQAEDMLQDYQENEEPKKLLNYMPKKIDDRPVLKDW